MISKLLHFTLYVLETVSDKMLILLKMCCQLEKFRWFAT